MDDPAAEFVKEMRIGSLIISIRLTFMVVKEYDIAIAMVVRFPATEVPRASISSDAGSPVWLPAVMVGVPNFSTSRAY